MIRLEKVKTDPVETLKRHAEAIGEAVRQAIKPDRITVEYPRERRKYPECFRGFIVFDKEKCISCFRCAQICPANAIQMEYFENAYPGIDYAKCIFCHFCVDSCPTGALNTSKVHDVAFKAMEEMRLSTKQIAKLPEIVREEIQTVEYYVDRNTWKLVRKKELDSLEVPPKPVKVKERKASCIEPESCIGCRLCANVCPQNAIKVERLKATEEGGTGYILKVQTEQCTGCGLCVRQCPMQILRLEEVGE